MPSIDYSKTAIYKLCCRNDEIKDVYVGHTTDIVRRKAQHKYHCNTEKSKKYNFPVYEFIRNNGGWDNWSLKIIEDYNCGDRASAETRERYWIEELGASLNLRIPTRTKKEHYNTNRDVLLEKFKEYYKNNRETINRRTTCECGVSYIKKNHIRHTNSQRHIQYEIMMSVEGEEQKEQEQEQTL